MLYAVTVELRSRGVVRTMPRFYVEALSEFHARQQAQEIVFACRFSSEGVAASFDLKEVEHAA